jgi:hypothetical protein
VDNIDFGAHAASERGLMRSPHWGTLENWIRSHYGDVCEVTGLGPVQIHHEYPFHDCILAGRPELELTLENLHRLYSGGHDAAQGHHLIVGHLRDYRSYNPQLSDCIAKWKGMNVDQIQALPEWKTFSSAKPFSYPLMRPSQQAAFRANLAQRFPKNQITVFDGKVFRRNGVIVTPA